MFEFFKRLFSSRAAQLDTAAEALAQVFSRHVTVANIRNERIVANAERIITGIATGEKRKYQWHAGSLARVSNKFAWKLIDRGYPREESLAVAKKLTIALMAKQKKANSN